MVREADGAVRASRDVTAFATLHERRVAAPVEQEDTLFLLRQTIRKRSLELFAHHQPQPVGRVARCDRHRATFAAINDVDGRKICLAHTLRERQQRVLA